MTPYMTLTPTTPGVSYRTTWFDMVLATAEKIQIPSPRRRSHPLTKRLGNLPKPRICLPKFFFFQAMQLIEPGSVVKLESHLIFSFPILLLLIPPPQSSVLTRVPGALRTKVHHLKAFQRG